MNILIIGAGKAGVYLANKLSEEKHDLVLVDTNKNALAVAEEHLDASTVCGSGSDPKTLEDAGVSNAGLLVAISSNDEVNMIACAYARAAGVPHCVASISNKSYLREDSKLVLATLGIDLVVNKADAIAREIFNIIRHPGAIEIIDLLEERIQVVGVMVGTMSPIIGVEVKNLADKSQLSEFRLVGIKRGEELIMPRGDTNILIGDSIYFAAKPENVDGILKRVGDLDMEDTNKVVIAGAGATGMNLARSLDEMPLNTVLIENDKAVAEARSEELERVLVVHGDGLDEDIMMDINVEQATFVAAMGYDERNMIGCMLADKLGARVKLAEIRKPHYVEMVNHQFLAERAISPYTSMSNAILHFVRGQQIRSATVLHNMPGELVEFILSKNQKWCGKAIRDLVIPDGCTIAAIERGTEVIVPTGEVTMTTGDRIILFAKTDMLGKLQKLFKK